MYAFLLTRSGATQGLLRFILFQAHFPHKNKKTVERHSGPANNTSKPGKKSHSAPSQQSGGWGGGSGCDRSTDAEVESKRAWCGKWGHCGVCRSTGAKGVRAAVGHWSTDQSTAHTQHSPALPAQPSFAPRPGEAALVQAAALRTSTIAPDQTCGQSATTACSALHGVGGELLYGKAWLGGVDPPHPSIKPAPWGFKTRIQPLLGGSQWWQEDPCHLSSVVSQQGRPRRRDLS